MYCHVIYKRKGFYQQFICVKYNILLLFKYKSIYWFLIYNCGYAIINIFIPVQCTYLSTFKFIYLSSLFTVKFIYQKSFYDRQTNGHAELWKAVNIFHISLPFYVTQIINSFLKSMISANHDKVDGLSANAMGKSLYRRFFLYFRISFYMSTLFIYF